VKTIGLLGGMSWESSQLYYKLINQGVARRLGGLHSAKLMMYSVDFEPIERMQCEGRWTEAGRVLGDAAVAVERGGAEMLLLCTNTMHKVAADIESRVSIPLLHIADVTAAAVTSSGVRRVGLLATRFTMEERFYLERLAGHGLDVVVPGARDRERVHQVIYDELCRGRIDESSRTALMEIVHTLEREGVQGVILGCTEIGMLLEQKDSPLPLYDSTTLHAEAAVDRALS
jgi:aspartate racemase